MACCHQPSPNSCSHHCHPPPPPPLDPLLLQSIASLLLHHYPPPPASASHGSPRSPLALAHHCCSDHSDHHSHKDSPTSPHHPPEQLSEPKCSVHSSLLQRMDLLESSFQQFSSPPSPDSALSLRDLAARRIQSRFRAFLVRRSRAFRRLKESLDSPSVSPRETIEDGDETALNSKRLMLRAFAGFLELVEGNFVRGNGVSSKTVKGIVPVSSDEKSPVSCASEESEVVSHAKALTCNSRERVQTRLSEFFEDMFLAQNASKHCRVAGDESGNLRVPEEHNKLQSNAERRVRFIEDENATKVYKSDRDLKDSTSVVSRDVKKVENKVEKQQDDVEVDSDGKKKPVESVDDGKDETENENEETLNEGSESENEDCEEEEEEEEEYETENEDCEEEEEDEYETENEGSENESRDCRGAENATGNSTQLITGLSDDAKKIEQKAENQQDDEEVESDDSQLVEGSEDEYETETENEGSEVEYETETEVCDDDDDDDEEEEEGEDVSEYEEETEYEEDEEEEASEVENARESKIPQDNKINGNGEECYQCMTQKLCGEHNFVKKRDMSNVVCYICFKRGHMKRACWYNPSRLCDKCHMIGHAQQVCGIVRKQQQLSQTSSS